jgi:tetratricopeptide (TPR) repeat protein
VQYCWVTSYFARSAPGFSGVIPYLARALLAGAAIWTVPALLFAPGWLGSVPFEAGLGALVASVVNLHHFVLDGAIWKLRDGRIARVLIRSEAASAPAPIEAPRRRPWRLAAWAVGAASLAIFVLAYSETEFGLNKAAARGDVTRMRTALARLDGIGRESALHQLQFGRILAQRRDAGGALRAYQESIRLFPTPDAWIALGDVLESEGQLEHAREAFDQALVLAPTMPSLVYRAATLAGKSGDAERARTLLEKAVELDPGRKLYRVALERYRKAGEIPAAEATP